MRQWLVFAGLLLGSVPVLSTAMDNPGFDAVYRSCFASDQNWDHRSISISPAGKYRTAWYDGAAAALPKVLVGVTASADTGIHYVGDFFGSSNVVVNYLGQMQLLTGYIKRRSERLPNDQWKEFRKACMVLCATSNYLKYEDSLRTKFGGLSSLVNSKRGVCTEFSNFADTLAGRVGIASRRVMNIAEGHAYVRFYMPGQRKWFYAEPQNASCQFYDTTVP